MKKLLSMLLMCVAAFGFVGCDNEPGSRIKLAQKEYYGLKPDSQHQINGSGLKDAQWSSGNEFVATAEGEWITTNKKGTTRMTCGTAVIHIGVDATITKYKEPEMTWGKHKSEFTNPSYTTADSYIYKTNHVNTPILIYLFDAYGNLWVSGSVTYLNKAGDLIDFLDERYVIYSANSSTLKVSFAHCSGKINNPTIQMVGQMEYRSEIGGILTTYVEGSSKSSRGEINDDVLEQVERILLESGIAL